MAQGKLSVTLDGMKFYAFHGFYEIERKVGNTFIVDVTVDMDLTGDPKDDLSLTVNYETIYNICRKAMRIKYKLLESCAYDIATDVKELSSHITNVGVKLSKQNPPVGGKVAHSKITINI